MTTINDIQRQMLTLAAQNPDGAIDTPDQDKRAAAGLVKRGFFISNPQPEWPSRLLITEAGRAAIAPAEPASDAEESGPKSDGAEPDGLEPVTEAKAQTSKTAQPKGKIAALVELLRRPDGATVEAMMAATGWQAHSVRGAIAGSIKKGLGLTVISEKTETGRRYRIPAEDQA